MSEMKPPGPLRMIMGSLGCLWLARTINIGFYTSATILLLLIPILLSVFRESVVRSEKINRKAESMQTDSV